MVRIVKRFARREGIKLGLYYFDIETTGWNPQQDKIISVQRQLIENDGTPKGDLVIWKIWGEDAFTEEQLIKTAYDLLMNEKNMWEIPVGYNLKFEQKMLGTKFEKYIPSFKWADWFFRPMLDLHPIGILINKGILKGSGLNKVSNKIHDGSIIPKWFEEKKYNLVEEYITQEADSFLEFYRKYFKLMAGGNK